MIATVISRAIKEAKWVAIQYENAQGKTTSYWIAVLEVQPSKNMKCLAYNHSFLNNDNDGLLEISISFSNIKYASVLEGTTYDVPNSLQEELEANTRDYKWLNYNNYSSRVLDYIQDCMLYEKVMYQKQVSMVSGIDENILSKSGYYKLSYEQMGEMAKSIEAVEKGDVNRHNSNIFLALNRCSISTNEGLFVIAYNSLLFNPKERSLIVDNKIKFNTQFAMSASYEVQHNIGTYLDIEFDDFYNMYVENEEKAKNLLQESLVSGKEQVDDRPYIMELQQVNTAYIYEEIGSLKESYKNKKMHAPLKAFFGDMSMRHLSGRRRDNHLIISDDRINVDQFRVLYNALQEPITYVQGPPGTGKTQCIVNLVNALFFNEQKALITSNNNKPLNDILDKIKVTYNGESISLPVFRYGNPAITSKSLKSIRALYEKYKDFDVNEVHLSHSKRRRQKHGVEVKEKIAQYETYLETEELIDALRNMLSYMSETPLPNMRYQLMLHSQIEKEEQKLLAMGTSRIEDIQSIIPKPDDLLEKWLFNTSIANIKKLSEKKYEKFLSILYNDDPKEQRKSLYAYLKDDTNLRSFLNVFPIVISTNHSVHRLGSATQHFDITIMDESSQCTMGHALFSIMRGRRLLLVGDLKQLKPVVTIPEVINTRLMDKRSVHRDYDYTKNSILSIMQKKDSISRFILLRYHYRCDPKIINFSNQKYYNDSLIIDSKSIKEESLRLLDVNSSSLHRSNIRNTSEIEAIAIVDDIKRNKQTNIGIITPYRNQAELLKMHLNEAGLSSVQVGTIHTFQGDEKDTIYLSCSITPHSSKRSFEWFEMNESLINVATTRARDELVIVGDLLTIEEKGKKDSDAKELIRYARHKGKYTDLTKSSFDNYINGSTYKQYNTVKEVEFFETINQILSLNAKFRLASQVKVSSVLSRFTDSNLFDYGTKSVFDLVIFERRGRDEIPVLVIELDGTEHTNDERVIQRDIMKEKICRDNNILIFRVTNDYSRRYIGMKDSIMQLLS